MKNILLVNDDGINDPKIKLLEEALKPFGNVYVCAPSGNRSCASQSIKFKAFNKDLLEKVDDNHYVHPHTPADSVRYMLECTDIKFDYCFSGMNDGINAGLYILYSGTVGAGFQATMNNLPSCSISNFYEDTISIDILNNIISFVFKNDLLNNEYLLNINIAKNPKINNFSFVPQKLTFNDTNLRPTDISELMKGYTTFTPLVIDRTGYDFLRKFNKIEIK